MISKEEKQAFIDRFKRRGLLNYLAKKDIDSYRNILEELGLRR